MSSTATAEQTSAQAMQHTFRGETIRSIKRHLRRGHYVIWHFIGSDGRAFDSNRIMDIHRRGGELRVRTLAGGTWYALRLGVDVLEVKQ